MNSAIEPVRSGLGEDIDPETASILAERDRTFEQDKRTAIDAKQAMSEIRRNLHRADIR